MKQIMILAAGLLMSGLAAQAQESIPVPEVNNYQTIYSATLGNAEGYAFDSWGGGTGEQITIGDKYAYRISNFSYFGSGFATIDATAMDYLHFDIYPMQDMSLTIVPITGRPEKGIQKELTGNEWNSFDLSVTDYVAKGANMANMYQIKYVSRIVNEGASGQVDGFANGNGSDSFIVGNVYLYKEQVAYEDNEAPVLVTAEVGTVTATSATLTLKATDNLSPNIYFTVTDNATGKEYHKTAASGAEAVLDLTGLAAGTTYNMNVVAADEKGNASEAQVVEFTTVAIPAVPALAAGDKLVLFSAHTDNAPGYFFDSWGGGTGNDIEIEGEMAYAISNFMWFGSQFNDVNATPYDQLHLDIYPLQDMTLAIVPITRGAAEKGIQVSLTGGEWNAIELLVQDYLDRGANMLQMWQIKYVSKVVNQGAPGAVDGFENGNGTETFIVGNVYLVTPSESTGIDTIQAEVNVDQPMYNVLGQRVNENYKGIVIQNGHKYIIK